MPKGNANQAGNKGQGSNPGAKGKGKSVEDPLAETLRALSGGGTRGKPPASAAALAKAAKDGPKDELCTWETGVLPWWIVSIVSFLLQSLAQSFTVPALVERDVAGMGGGDRR